MREDLDGERNGMSDDLFSRLIKNRSTDRQRHVENFLSELLREFLNRLAVSNPASHLAFVRDTLLADCSGDAGDVTKQLSRAVRSLEWQSQYPITQRRKPDLVLLVGSKQRPLLIVKTR